MQIPNSGNGGGRVNPLDMAIAELTKTRDHIYERDEDLQFPNISRVLRSIERSLNWLEKFQLDNDNRLIL